MANDNIKRYLDYDGLAYLINKFNSVIEANEYTTSEALNDLNRKIAEININDNTGGFPIIDADITQVDSVYTTTENLNELITPGQYIIDSSKIQYEDDTFIKTLYWLLSVDKVIYNNSESIVQTYFPLSYLTYSWHNIPIGGLLQRFYEGNNTWTDLQVAAPGDVDPSKFATKNEFDTNINTINTSINNINTSITTINEEIVDINETIEGLSKTDNDTKCESGTINADTEVEDPTSDVVSVIKNQDIPLSGDGTYLSGNATAVNVVTKQYVDQNFIPNSESDRIWEAINAGKVDSISLEKSGITKTIADEEVNIPYINNKISFTEGLTGSFVGKFDVISLPTKNYVINNYVSNQTLSTTLNDYVDKESVIPNILKNGTPQAGDNGKDFSLQWYQTSKAITDTNSTDYNDICAPSYTDFSETSSLFNINSMVIRAFWTHSYFHDIWMSPNTDHIFHRSINSSGAKPWKILLDNSNCGKYIKNVIKDSVDTDQIKINNHFYCNPYANFFNSISISNSKNIEIVSVAQSKLTSTNSAELGIDTGDIIFYKNVGKTYKNPDESLISDWPSFTSGQPGGKFTEHYGPMEIGRIYTTYTSANRCTFTLRKAIGLESEDNPKNKYIDAEIIDSVNFPNYLQQNNVITNSNISSNLPSTVITTNNIPSHISSSNSFKFKDSGGALIEYVVHSEKDNILSTQQLGVNTDYNIICRPDHINTWNNYNIVSSYYNVQLLRLKFGTKYFHDIFVDPNSEYIMHRSVRSSTAYDWQLLLDTKNISKWFGSTLPGSADMVDKVTATIITGKNIKPASIDVTGNINVGGGVYETSDETLKDFQDSIQVNFEQLKEIPKAYFTFKDDKTGETKIGTSAQKVKEFYPELVSENNNGILSVDYAKLSMVALKAVDILDDRITKLEKLVEQLINNK